METNKKTHKESKYLTYSQQVEVNMDENEY